jgi:hypothetical protein
MEGTMTQREPGTEAQQKAFHMGGIGKNDGRTSVEFQSYWNRINGKATNEVCTGIKAQHCNSVILKSNKSWGNQAAEK